DHAVDPPRAAFFSSNTTERPRALASIAAASPAPPPPTTITSNISCGRWSVIAARSLGGLGGGVTSAPPCNLPEYRTRHEARAAWIIEIKDSADHLARSV